VPGFGAYAGVCKVVIRALVKFVDVAFILCSEANRSQDNGH
jgi:hypothetical protein